MSKAIFVYSCAPTRPAGPDDGGFSVNLFEENMLVYTRYAVDGSVIKEWQFAVPPRVIMEYMAGLGPGHVSLPACRGACAALHQPHRD